MGRLLPNLESLHERHHGFAPHINAACELAARVCFARHHEPPQITFRLSAHAQPDEDCSATWLRPTEREVDSCGNDDDATRDGAYAVALAAVELTAGLMAVSRAEVLRGADYYVAPPGDIADLEAVARLEVSGMNRGSEADIARRLEEKIQQAAAPDLNGPALACVVVYQPRRIALQHLE